MFIYNLLLLRVTLSIFFGINYLQPAKSAPADSHHTDFYNLYPVVYQRYVRRRPPIYLHDKYMEDIVEIFDTKEKPPAYDGLITDEEVDKFIFCDFNRQLDICKQYWDAREPTRSTSKHQTSTATSTSNHHTLATAADDLSFLKETEYIYSEENPEVEKKPQEITENYDYYDDII